MPASAGSIGPAYVAEGPAPYVYAYWGPQRCEPGRCAAPS